MERFVILVAVVVTHSQVLSAQSSPYCAMSRSHTMCQYNGFGSRCSGLTAYGVGLSDTQVILHEHNKFRATVANGFERRGAPGPQPAAANMEALVWDSELAAIAQRWANQCNLQHDSFRDVRRFNVGQNIFIFSTTRKGTSANWVKAIRDWSDEVSRFNPAYIYPFGFSYDRGHFTAMTWATTNRVGCGYVQFRNGAFYTSIYICNYGPAGNTISQNMYIKGRPCTRCPRGRTCSRTYPGLCS